ncbi:MAG: hypothetical protein E7637_00625 [Ruminococcaceae bacterium]|nr:hypothetical protein [Oscillospiraceae bacterium]
MRIEKRRWVRPFALLLGCMAVCLSIPTSAASQTCAYRSVKTESRRIALTFDDGPHPTQTKRILDILDRYGVHATFFMVGENVENYSDAAKEVAARGNEIGNHTFSHARLGCLDTDSVNEEIEHCEKTIERICGTAPRLFRPPQGILNEAIEGCSVERDYRLILWSLDTRDWEVKNTQRIVETVLSSIKAGDIVLMHDYIGTHSRTAEALEILLPTLLQRGFEPVTVGELLDSD